MNKRHFLLLVLLIVLVALAIHFRVLDYLNTESLVASRDRMLEWRQQYPLRTAALFFVTYVAIIAVSLPGAAVMTMAAGAIFGFGWGIVLASFASTLGALLAFLIARRLFRDAVQRRFGTYMKVLNRGIERDGNYYLFSLRMVPAIPFLAINLAMALTPMRVWSYYWVSQIGMLPATAIFVYAGMELGRLDAGGDILTPSLIGSLILLAAFPWIARFVLRAISRGKALKRFQRPHKFDYNLLVIGGGAAGLVAAYIGATVKAKVALVERDRMGGDCLNYGCVPSKTLIRSARIARYIQRSREFGIDVQGSAVDFSMVMARVHRAIERIEPHDSAQRYTGLGVDCLHGEARLLSPWEVEVDGRHVSARHIVLATGGRPKVPPIPGIDEVGYLTSETLWQLRELPRRLLVLGAGPIGCELAQAFRRLGAEVIVVEQNALLAREDEDVRSRVARQFEHEGIRLYCDVTAIAFGQDGDKTLRVSCDGEEITLAFDQLLVAAGRQANVDGLGLEQVGVRLREDGTVDVDRYLRTHCPSIYACGDVTGPYQFTHVAAHQAWYAAVNSLFGVFRRFAVDYATIPWVTFTDPEVARVGLNEHDARRKGIAFEVTRFDLEELDRAIADGENSGFIKVLTPPGRDRILGVTIVGYHASELLTEFALAMKHGLGLKKILGTIHAYPTLGEANKYAAGEWAKAHKPERLLRWVQRFHAWRR